MTLTSLQDYTLKAKNRNSNFNSKFKVISSTSRRLEPIELENLESKVLTGGVTPSTPSTSHSAPKPHMLIFI